MSRAQQHPIRRARLEVIAVQTKRRDHLHVEQPAVDERLRAVVQAGGASSGIALAGSDGGS